SLKPTAISADTGMRARHTAVGSSGASGTVYGIVMNCCCSTTAGGGGGVWRNIETAVIHAAAATPAATAQRHTGTRRAGNSAITRASNVAPGIPASAATDCIAAVSAV